MLLRPRIIFPLLARRRLYPPTRRLTTVGCTIIGDEILSGKTQDTNSHFLAQYCFGLGMDLKRIEVVPDEEAAIGESVKEMSKRYDVVFTSGGIGPTHDDITYDAIAKAFHLPLQLDAETWHLIQKQRPFSPDTPEEVTRARQRMAIFPSPVEIIRPCEGVWVPIVVVNGNVHILPGIPRFFRMLLEGYRPWLEKRRKGEIESGARYWRTSVVTRLPESIIAPWLTRAQEKHRDSVRIGSYPQLVDDGRGWQVTVSFAGLDREKVRQTAEEVAKQIEGTLIEGTSGGKV
ncbi:uncharacterized protein VTP21DRAFT_8346 [Calcarisporiella thermophila]|uniref:uncharacterized protein n=1 Tax=Calcarisporiella thermophila TaxID=911321 RepID=UPI003744A207